MKPVRLGIVGVGKIVLDQHYPSVTELDEFELVATASRNASIDGVAAYTDIDSMLDAESLDAVALCMPPQFRFDAAKSALMRGVDVLLEKPPGASLSEVSALVTIAQENSAVLYASWHSRHAPQVEHANSLLQSRKIKSVSMTWKESVRKWHPGQEWIWQPGGLGVFDPGINGFSILTACINDSFIVSSARLEFPENTQTAIAATIEMRTSSGVPVLAELDWDIDDGEQWSIVFETDSGTIELKDGGARILVDGEESKTGSHPPIVEYLGVYRKFSSLIKARLSEVDVRPLQMVADTLLVGEQHRVEAFFE